MRCSTIEAAAPRRPCGIAVSLAATLVLLCPGLFAADRTHNDNGRLEALVRYLLLWGPDIKVDFDAPRPSPIAGYKEIRARGTRQDAVQTEIFFVSDDGKRVIQGSVFETARNPFEATAARIAVRDQPRRGPANAPVKMVVFSDFECPMCRKLADEIRSDVQTAYGDRVSVYFKDLPLAQKHPWAFDAAIAGRCVYRQSGAAFWVYHDWIFAHQSEIVLGRFREQALESVAKEGIDRARLTSCIDSKATESEIRNSMREASELGVPGTPTVFLNGRKMPGPSWPMLRAAIDFELKQAAAKSEDCHCTEPTGTEKNR